MAVGIAEQLAAYLTRGEVRNAVNVPSMSREARERFGPYLKLCEKLGSLAAQIAPTGVREVRVTFAGEVTEAPQRLLTAAVLKGLLSTVESSPVNEVSAPGIARDRGIAVLEERAAGHQDYASLVTVVVGAGGRGGGGGGHRVRPPGRAHRPGEPVPARGGSGGEHHPVRERRLARRGGEHRDGAGQRRA